MYIYARRYINDKIAVKYSREARPRGEREQEVRKYHLDAPMTKFAILRKFTAQYRTDVHPNAVLKVVKAIVAGASKPSSRKSDG